MKRYNYIAFLFLVLGVNLFFTSCEKYLDVVPSETISSEDVLDNIVNAEKIWARLYGQTIEDYGLLETNGKRVLLAACTDESMNHFVNPQEFAYNSGSWSAANNPLGNLIAAYQNIRLANIFLENIDNASIPADKLAYYKPRIPAYKADVRFLRAMNYFELFRRYGAVPLITKSYNVGQAGGVVDIMRCPVDSLVNFICDECDAAAAELPLTYSDNPSEIGRVTKGAAMSLKAITLLYAASPLFNGNMLYADIKNPDGAILFTQAYDKAKWKRAADAAKAVMDLGVYSLYSPLPDNPVANYAQLFYTREYNETILPLMFSSTRNVETWYLPFGKDAKAWGAHGELSVSQNLVDAYEMNNGLPVTDPNSGYDSTGFWDGKLWDGKAFRAVKNISNLYKNRDPRFYATITFNGEYWDSANHTRPVSYSYWAAANGATDGIQSGKGNLSGYGFRKWCDPSVNPKASKGNANRNYPVIRYAEILLAYAEALNEYEGLPTDDVYKAINQVRSRVSMPPLPITAADHTTDGMRQRIHNEWRVEFAFENHRFWDVRRWLIGTKVDNGPLYGLNTAPSGEELKATGLNVNGKEAGLAVYYKRIIIQNRTFTKKDYLFPITQSEIDKNHNLVQNYGW